MKYLCGNCLEMVDSHVVTKKEEHEVKGVKITIDAEVRICNQCGEEMFDRELDGNTLDRVYEIYRKRAGLLSIEKMKSVREKYGLSQTAFAKVLGLGEKTIARYETGSIPDEAPNNLVFLCDKPTTFKVLLEKNREKISEDEYQKASRCVNRLVCFCGCQDNFSLGGGDAQQDWPVDDIAGLCACG